MKKGDRLLNIIIKFKWVIIPVLFLCALVIFSLSGISYAKYYDEFKDDNSANVAVMANDVVIDYTLSELNLFPGAEISLPVNITNVKNGNIAEVNQQYTLTVETTNNIPLTCVFLNSNNQEVTPTGQFNAGIEQIHKYTIKILWDSSYNDYNYSNEIEVVRVIVHSTQMGG